MKARLGITLLNTIICASPLLAEACLPYGVSQTLKGRLTSHQGLRSWWGIRLDRSICTLKHPTDLTGAHYADVDELQLIFLNQDSFAKYEGLLNHRVSVSGKLMGRATAYHQTNVLIIVDQVASLDGVQVQEPRTAKQKLPPLRDLESYSAAVTVLPRPASRVIEQAWDKDPASFFPDSDRYVEHMFNGPMDIMWVKCREGYKIESPESSTNSSIFQMDPRSSTNPYWGVAVSDSQRTNITVRCLKH
jgi:hypothetical protein